VELWGITIVIFSKRHCYLIYIHSFIQKNGKKYHRYSKKWGFGENKYKFEIDGSTFMILLSINLNGSNSNLSYFMIPMIFMELNGPKWKI
jgi:hypothetical protein